MKQAAHPLLESEALVLPLGGRALRIFWRPHPELLPQACVFHEQLVCCLHLAASLCAAIACPRLAARIHSAAAALGDGARPGGAGRRRPPRGTRGTLVGRRGACRYLRLDELELFSERREQQRGLLGRLLGLGRREQRPSALVVVLQLVQRPQVCGPQGVSTRPSASARPAPARRHPGRPETRRPMRAGPHALAHAGRPARPHPPAKRSDGHGMQRSSPT